MPLQPSSIPPRTHSLEVVIVSGLGPGALEAPPRTIHVVMPARECTVLVVLRGGTLRVRAPKVALLSDAMPHEIRWGDGTGLVILALDAAFFGAQCRAEFGILRRIVDARCDEDAFLRRAGETLCRARREDGGVGDRVERLAPSIALHIASRYGKQVACADGLAPDSVQRVLCYIEQNLGRPLPLQDLAALAHMGTCHFVRKFRQSTGCTPHRFVTGARIARARELLAATRMPLVEVAACVGYETQAHFTATFHRHVGMTPLRYRRGACRAT
jgi:AraC-like DNA-binding protein